MTNEIIEVWRDYVDPELGPVPYQVSNHGRVLSVGSSGRRHVKEDRVLACALNNNGYPSVLVCLNGVERRCSVHRMVALCFLGDPIGDRGHVNHIDFDRTNNHVENLEWVSRLENFKHSFDHGKYDNPRNPKQSPFTNVKRRKKLTSEQVEEIRSLLMLGVKGVYLANQFGVDKASISFIKNQKRWVVKNNHAGCGE